MWPERGEALSRTIECEAALTEVYALALNTWVVATEPFVVSSLVAASLPPEPDSVTETASVWDQLSSELILACLSSLWALSVVEASEGLEIDLPEFDENVITPSISVKVVNAITSTSEVATDELVSAIARVEADPFLLAARDEYLDSQRPSVASTPTLMRDRVVAAVRDATPALADDTPDVEVVITEQRRAAAEVLSPGSEATRVVARLQGYGAASVQNAAVVTAAHRSEDATTLDKTWIATLDGKTRHTHFAADGQRTPLTGKFQIGTAQLDYPADPGGPPEEVKNCRCRVGILAHDEAIPDEVDRHTERLDGRDSVQINRRGSQQDEIERRERQGTVRAREDEDGIGRTAQTAAGGWTAPSEQEYGMTQYVTFTDQPVAFVGIESSDGRMLSPDIDLTVRQTPLPVMWCQQTNYGHMDAYTVGVTEAARLEGDRILASGYMLDDEHSSTAFDHAARKVSRPSIDLAATEWMLVDENGKEITEDEWWDLPMDAKVIQCVTKGELIGFTLVATPAFGETMLEFNPEPEDRELGLVASAAEQFRPRVYPAAQFVRTPDQYLTEPTEIQMDPDTGRIFGHLACFGSCHRSLQAQCVMAPKSPSNYSQFHTSPSVRLDDGTRLAVGRLTVGTGHADERLGGAAAMSHYDNTGSCFALVRAYETPVGIEVSGVAAPWATAEQIEMGLAAPLSGDWRDFGQGLDLIAALAVNTPGFAVRGREDADGRSVALVASLAPKPTGPRGTSGTALTASAISEIVAAAVTKALTDRDEQAELDALLAEATQLVGEPAPALTPEQEIDAMLAELAGQEN
jgi:hypothetical protein